MNNGILNEQELQKGTCSKLKWNGGKFPGELGGKRQPKETEGN